MPEIIIVKNEAEAGEIYVQPVLVPGLGYQPVTLTIRRLDGTARSIALLLRIDTPVEVEYYQHGGILPYVLRELLHM